MGKQFGNLQWLTGVNFYVLSPHELRPFKGILNPGFLNTLRRFGESAPIVAIPFIYVYSVYTFTTDKYHKLKRKNPNDYKDDV